MGRKKKETTENSKFYKGYDIRWLRDEPSHPDYYLVAEYDAANGVEEIEEVEDNNIEEEGENE